MPPRSLAPLLSLLIAASSCGPPSRDAVVHVAGGAAVPSLVEVTPSAEPGREAPPVPAVMPWETSRSAARARARDRGAPILVFLFAAWSTAAVRMDRTTWTDARVLRRARSFIPLRVDVTEADANAQVSADDLDVEVLPCVLLLDELGHEIARIDGYAGPDEVLAVMGRALPGD